MPEVANKNIMVTIICVTYNHGKYIREALEGFVNQKTDFNYEIIVHDDASTDNTADIIKEYMEIYPNIIKPIFQKENQYSKGVRILRKYIMPKIKGKYVAFCDGDDYWCCNNKLQKQIDFLEKNDKYSASVHQSLALDVRTNEKVLYSVKDAECDITFEDVIVYWGRIFHTSSVVGRTALIKDTESWDCIGNASVGDFPLALLMGANGKIRFTEEVMSVYRIGVGGSFTVNSLLSIDYQIKIIQSDIEILKYFDKYTKKKYHNVIQKSENIKKVRGYVLKKDFSSIEELGYRTLIDIYGYKKVAMLFFYLHCSRIFKLISRYK